MSTKTAFKRVALVAAAALAIGGLSTVSANAGTAPLINSVATSSTASITTGNYTLESFTAGSADKYYTISSTGGTVNYPATATGATLTATGGNEVWSAGSGAIGTASFAGTETLSVSVFSAVAGTQVVTLTGNTSAAITLTITWGAAQTISAANSTAFIGLPGTTPVADAALVVADAVNTDAANIAVVIKGSDGAAFTNETATVSASVSGPGLILVNGTVGTVHGTGRVSSFAANTAYVHVTSDGTAGVGTITLTATDPSTGTVISLGSKTVTFSGAAVKIVLTAINPVIAVGTAAAELTAGITANTNALEIQEFDANGNAIAVNPATITVTSAAAATATAGAASVAVGAGAVNFLAGLTTGTALSATVAGVSLAGIAAGTTTFTATDSVGTLASLPVSVRVSSAVVTKVDFTTDAASYAAGAVGTLTITLSDAVGTVPAGTYTVFTAGSVASSFALATGTLPAGATLTVNDSGVATVAFNAPITDATGVTIGGTAPAASTIVVTPATFDVVSGSSAAAQGAVDAANEATDAANAATDAANAAADSADAATQAAQDAGAQATAALAATVVLTQQVSKIFLSMHKLSALLVRLIHKVHA